jgi:hypothetical protein
MLGRETITEEDMKGVRKLLRVETRRTFLWRLLFSIRGS